MTNPIRYNLKLTVNGHKITSILIGRHYLVKHGSYMNDDLILQLVKSLDKGQFLADSTTNGIDYYVADVQQEETGKIYRIIWLFEGQSLEVLGVVMLIVEKRKGKNR